MKNLIVTLFIGALFSFQTAHGDTLYHCPELSDIKYEKGFFSSETNYNGLSIRWFSFQSFPEKYVTVKKMIVAVRENCTGGECHVRCTYETSTHANQFLHLYVNYGHHKSLEIGLGPWDYAGNYCQSPSSGECQFYLN